MKLLQELKGVSWEYLKELACPLLLELPPLPVAGILINIQEKELLLHDKRQVV